MGEFGINDRKSPKRDLLLEKELLSFGNAEEELVVEEQKGDRCSIRLPQVLDIDFLYRLCQKRMSAWKARKEVVPSQQPSSPCHHECTASNLMPACATETLATERSGVLGKSYRIAFNHLIVFGQCRRVHALVLGLIDRHHNVFKERAALVDIGALRIILWGQLCKVLEEQRILAIGNDC